MAIVKKGNALGTKLIQPGGTYTNDGYGLMTGRTTYYVDKSSSGSAVTTGQPHPEYSDFYVHKFTLIKGALEMDMIEAEYVGINSSVGERTNPNVTASHGLTSEHITTHPNFFGGAPGFNNPIAGNGTTFTTSTINPDEKVGGDFGAHFKGTATNAGGFLGFKDSSTISKQYYYGKTHYLSPVTSFSGVIYSRSNSDFTTIKNAIGKTSSTSSFSGIQLLPSYMGGSWSANIKGTSRDTIMLSQASFESYCVASGGTPQIIKINYEIRYNREGYPAEVYASA